MIVHECSTITEVLELVLGRETLQRQHGSKKRNTPVEESSDDDENEEADFPFREEGVYQE